MTRLSHNFVILDYNIFATLEDHKLKNDKTIDVNNSNYIHEYQKIFRYTYNSLITNK